MDIRIREPLYIIQGGHEYIVRPGTVGVEKNKIVFFYDVTRTAASGFSREFCLENPSMFQVSRTLSDKDVSLKDVLKTIECSPYLSEQTKNPLMEELRISLG